MTPQQKIEFIKVKDLRLWSENPRDPIGEDIGDLEILRRAIKNDQERWGLNKIIEEMGDYYDTSELPTVVYHNDIPIIYDANRRVAVLKYAQNPEWHRVLEHTLFPRDDIPEDFKNRIEIPCNVCDEETALENIYRKHIKSSSWKHLERDYFELKHRNKPKSLFIKFDEATGLIKKYPKLNERIMKDSILTESALKKIGFAFDENDKLISMYDKDIAHDILNTMAELKKDGIISSRDGEKHKKYDMEGPLKDVPEFKDKIKSFTREQDSTLVDYPKESDIIRNTTKESGQKNRYPKHTPRQPKLSQEIFGGKVILIGGDVNDLYRDIVDLYDIYLKYKDEFSSSFPNLIRMTLRLLVESASGGYDSKAMDTYIDTHFESAKAQLDQDQDTTLSNHSVDSVQKLKQLLHTGVHNYSSSANIEQTLAMSIIIGEMLKITHSKK